jgi:hypothetical protein
MTGPRNAAPYWSDHSVNIEHSAQFPLSICLNQPYIRSRANHLPAPFASMPKRLPLFAWVRQSVEQQLMIEVQPPQFNSNHNLVSGIILSPSRPFELTPPNVVRTLAAAPMSKVGLDLLH